MKTRIVGQYNDIELDQVYSTVHNMTSRLENLFINNTCRYQLYVCLL